MVKLGKYMTADAVGLEPEAYIVRSSNGDPIGLIEWYARWRQYAMTPEPETVFSADCLRDLAGFCERLNREQLKAETDRRVLGHEP